jgi:radical SAM superfamily enzyme YgiQ (UPF0313 family)
MKVRRILLIQPPSDLVDDDRVEPPLGLLYIAACLKQDLNNEVDLLDLSGSFIGENKNFADVLTSVPQADIYGISCLSTNYFYVKQIVQQIKKQFLQSIVVLGGPQPSALPEWTLKDSAADAVIVGEGEDAFNYLVEQIRFGYSFPKIIPGEGRAEIDSYPFPARELVDYSSYSRRLCKKPVVSLLSSRGCIHRCIYCNSVVMGGSNRRVRYRSVANILAEIEILKEKFSYFRFNDDNFTGNRNLPELLNQLAKVNIQFRAFAHVRDLTFENCLLLKKAGCVHVSVGVESLNPQNLQIIGKKSLADCLQNIKIAKEAGLVVRASFMVGLPFDTDANIQHFFSQATALGIVEYAVYPLIPYPGTLIWSHPDKLGYRIVDADFTKYIQMGKNRDACFALDHENFSAADVRRWKNQVEEIFAQSSIKHMSESKVAN